MRIKDLIAEERPREKLLERGVRSLSKAELLAILIGSGVGRRNALEIAQDLLSSVEGKLSRLSSLSPREIQRPGVGITKAIIILAALEAGRRVMEEKAVVDKIPLTGADEVYEMMLPVLKHLDHEECWILYLNKGNYLMAREKVASGGPGTTSVDTTYVVRKVIERQASAVVMVHNHPSGDPTPGRNDIEMTKYLKKALSAFNVPLLDHVVVAEDSYFSFSDDRKVTADQSLPPKAKSPASPRPGTM